MLTCHPWVENTCDDHSTCSENQCIAIVSSTYYVVLAVLVFMSSRTVVQIVHESKFIITEVGVW
jgi:hypothetical protein